MPGFIRRQTAASDLCQLDRCALLAGLGRGDLAIVDSLLHTRRFLPGEVVFDQGDEGQALYIVRRGEVSIHVGDGTAPAVARLGPGDFFGEMALLDDSPRSAQARASQECVLSALFRGDFERLLEAHARIASGLALQLARQLGSRLRGMLEQRAAPGGGD